MNRKIKTRSRMGVVFVLLVAMALSFGGTIFAESMNLTVNHKYDGGKTAATENEFVYDKEMDLSQWAKKTNDNKEYELYKIEIEKTKKEAVPALLSYTIVYYKDSFEPANVLGEDKTNTAAKGEVVTLTQKQLNAKQPTGYKDGVATPATLTVTQGGQVIKILYEPETKAPAPKPKATMYIHFVNFYTDQEIETAVMLSDVEPEQNVFALANDHPPSNNRYRWMSQYSFASTFAVPAAKKTAEAETTIQLNTTAENHLVLYYIMPTSSDMGESDSGSAVYRAEGDESTFGFSDVRTENGGDAQQLSATTEVLTDDYHYIFKTGYTYKVTMYYKNGQATTTEPSAPETGNSNLFGLAAVLFTVSGIALTVFATKRRDKLAGK